MWFMNLCVRVVVAKIGKLCLCFLTNSVIGTFSATALEIFNPLIHLTYNVLEHIKCVEVFKMSCQKGTGMGIFVPF